MTKTNSSDTRFDHVLQRIFIFLCWSLLFIPGLMVNLSETSGVYHLWRHLILWSGAFVLISLHLMGGGLKVFALSTKSRLFFLYMLYLGFQLFSAFRSANSAFALQTLVDQLALYVWAVSALHFWRSGTIKNHLKYLVLLVVATIVLSYGWNTFELLNDFSFNGLKSAFFMAGTEFPFYNPNLVAGFMMPLALALWMSRRHSLYRVPWWLLIVCVLVVCVTSSRAAVAVMVLMVSLELARSRWGARRLVYFMTGFILSAVVIAGTFVKKENVLYDSTAGVRLQMWQGVVKALRRDHVPQNPLTVHYQQTRESSKLLRTFHGMGPGTYPLYSAMYREPEYYAGVYVSTVDFHPHSSVFSALFETGLAGLFLMALFFCLTGMILGRHSLLANEKGAWSRVMGMMALALALYSLVSVAPHYLEHQLLWVFVVSAAVSLELGTRNLYQSQQKKWPTEFSGPAHAILLIVIAGLCWKGSYLKIKELQGLRVLAQINTKEAPLQEIRNRLSDYEETLFDERHWLSPRRLRLMTDYVLFMENAARSKAQKQVELDQVDQVKMESLSQMKQIFDRAPHFEHASRLYGMLKWSLYVNMKSHPEAFELSGLKRHPRYHRERALILMRHHLKKGAADTELFGFLLRHPEARQALEKEFRSHPVNSDFFASRVDSKRLNFDLSIFWLKLQLDQPLEGESLEKVFRVMERLAQDMPGGVDRVQISHSLSRHYLELCLRAHIDIRPGLWNLIELGGNEKRPESHPIDSYLELMRTRLFEGEKTASKALEELKIQEKYPDLLSKVEFFMQTAPKIGQK